MKIIIPSLPVGDFQVKAELRVGIDKSSLELSWF